MYRASCDELEKAPLPGYRVKLKILSGPKAFFVDPMTHMETNETEMATETNDAGIARIRLYQKEPALGENKIRITIKHPDDSDELCCPEDNDIIATGEMTQTWTLAN